MQRGCPTGEKGLADLARQGWGKDALCDGMDTNELLSKLSPSPTLAKSEDGAPAQP